MCARARVYTVAPASGGAAGWLARWWPRSSCTGHSAAPASQDSRPPHLRTRPHAARVFSSGNPATLWSCDTASAHARRARTRRVARNEGSPHGEEGDERRVGRRRRPANIRAAHRLVAAVVVGRVQLSTASEPCSMRIPSRSLDAPRATRHSHTRVAHDLTRTLECTDESKSWTTRASIHLCVNCSAEF